jgi:hypothetical protein
MSNLIKIYLFFIVFLLVSCEKEDLSKFDSIVNKYNKVKVESPKPEIKKKRRWKLRFIHRNRERKTTQSKY